MVWQISDKKIEFGSYTIHVLSHLRSSNYDRSLFLQLIRSLYAAYTPSEELDLRFIRHFDE